MSDTDCVGKLDLAFVSQTCCNDILCNVTCCICCRTVYFCAVFSGESSAAVTSHSTVCINDDLTSCQTCITVRSTDYETSCRIDEEFCLIIDQLCRKDRIEYIFFDILMDLLLSYIIIMLCGKNNSL